MSRAWDEFVASVFDVVPLGTLLLALLLGAALTGALWYWFPAWVPTRLPRWKLPRWKLPRRTTKDKSPEPVDAEDTEPVITPAEPVVPAATTGGLSPADRLAAEGRYAEAIRQRLRETLGELVARRLVPSQPGWTAAELAGMASTQRPAVASPLSGATELFSEIWYGGRPADRTHDERMRALTDRVRAAL